MKKSLTKVLVSCAAVMSVSAIMAVSASAAGVSYDAENKQIKNEATVPVTAGQATILVIDKSAESALEANNIHYIDQQEVNGNNPWATIAADLADGEYLLKMGGEGVAADAVVKESFTVGEQVGGVKRFMGDVNKDNAVDGTDALIIARAYNNNAAAKTILSNETSAKLADVNTDGVADGTDALIIARAYNNNAAAKAFIVEVDVAE